MSRWGGNTGFDRMAPKNLARTIEVINAGIAAGLHPGAQLYVSLDGRALVNVALGSARDTVPMTPDSLPLWLSAGKPLAAIAIAQLIGRNLLTLDDPVARHIPEFAANGKGDITVRHMLTHTSPLRSAASNTTPEPWDAIIARICAARPEARWPSGQRAGYHAASTWLILGELVRRLDGRPYGQYVAEEIFGPVNMHDCSVGMTPEQYDAWEPRLALLYATDRVRPVSAAGFLNTRAGCLVCRPGGNARGPIAMLGRFYEMLLAGGIAGGHRVLAEDLVRQFTTRQRVGMFDETFKKVIDWGLGFIIDSKQYGPRPPYGFGPHASETTFGHAGHQSSCAFADPQHRLVVAWVCNGQPGEQAHQQRAEAINAAIYEDLSLT